MPAGAFNSEIETYGMKQLEVKQIEALSTLVGGAAQVECMIREAERQVVDTINWAEYGYRPEVSFYVAWSGGCFFLLFDVREDAVKAVCTDHHSPVYEDSCVEFFVQRPGMGTYRNFEFNCIGTVLSAVRESRSSYRYLPEEVMDGIGVYTSLPREPLVRNLPTHWLLLAAIPLRLLDVSENDPVGVVLHANFYKCGDKTPVPHFVSWNPIETPSPDFHRPEFFGEMRFTAGRS
jgi:hypothetical protein